MEQEGFYTPQGQVEFNLEQDEDQMTFLDSLLDLGIDEEAAKEIWKEYGSGGY